MGIGDWLGTGKVSRKHYRNFKAARTWARSLGLKSVAEWRKMIGNNIKPTDIPSNPDSSYQNAGWASWSDWLGTDSTATRKRKYRLFTKARAFVHELNLKSRNEWTDYCKGKLANQVSKPDDIPASPERTYSDAGWNGFGDWLGTGNVANQNRRYQPFNDARNFARSLNLQSGAEWIAYCKGLMRNKPPLPGNVPAYPNQTYNRAGWRGMGDWLGTGNVTPRNKVYRNFKEAHEFTLKLKLKNQKQWRSYCKGHIKGLPSLPEDMPANPDQVYKHTGWVGFGHWLGTGTIAPRLITYRDFQAARNFARSLKLKDGREWRLFCKGVLKQKGILPADIPKAPEQVYAKLGWAGTGDWLGTGAVATFKRAHLPFAAARDFVHKLRLKSVNEWHLFCRGALPEKGKLPDNIPASPGYKYSSSGWKGFSDWLGNGIAPKKRKKS